MAEREPNAHQFTLDDILGTDTAGFMDLEIPGYAYMFGFLQADGHLSQQSRQRGRLTVEINVRDIDLLRRFQELTRPDQIQPTRPALRPQVENDHSAPRRPQRASRHGLAQPAPSPGHRASSGPTKWTGSCSPPRPLPTQQPN